MSKQQNIALGKNTNYGSLLSTIEALVNTAKTKYGKVQDMVHFC